MPVRTGANDGVHGVLGNVKDMGQLVALLKPYFLPASLAAPPHFTPTAAPATIAPGSRSTIMTGSLRLEQLSDVRVSGPTNGQVLTYVAAVAEWENASPITGVTAVTASAPLASSGGTTPNISLTGIVPIVNGGTGSTTQNFVDLTTDQTIGGNKTFSDAVQSPNGFTAGPSAYYPYGCYINGGINVATSLSAASASFTTPLPIASGGTATATPALVAGANVTISGAWPNQTINSSNPGGTVTSVTASGALASSGGATPNITLTAPLSIANGGTASTTQNFVDLSTAQTAAGAKTFSGSLTASGAFSVGSGASLLLFNQGFSTTVPLYGNSGDGGINVSIASTTANGIRFFSYSGALVQLMQILPTSGNTSILGTLTAASFVVSPSGPTISTGSAVPSGPNVAGSLYFRSPGAAGARIYVGQGGSTWTPIPTV